MDGIDIFIASENIDPNFSEEEKTLLIEHYKNGDFNQYYLVVIKKVVPDHEPDKILKVMAFATEVNARLHVNKEDNEDIIANACALYKILMIKGTGDIGNREL